MGLASKIEAILFYRAEATTKKDLVGWLGVTKEELEIALTELAQQLTERDLRLLTLDERVELGTAPELADLLQSISQEELAPELGKATMETLTIVVYQGPISRPAIDQIRGVNSSFSLRQLMIRGLIERFNPETNTRSFLYRPTLDLLRHLGLDKLSDLPEYVSVQAKLNTFLNNAHENETAKND